MDKIIYVDHSATTYVKKEVLEEMLPYFTEKFGNASSPYRIGQVNREAVEKAREQVAKAINAEAREIKDYIENIILNRSKNQGTVVQQASPAEELKKFKELLDMGVISQEEFDAKKKQILGL